MSKTDVGLSNVDNTADASKPVSTAVQNVLDTKLDASQKGAASGVAALDGSSKVADANLPSRLQDSSLATVYAAAGTPSYVGGRTGRYDSFQCAYNWKPSNTRRLRLSLARAAAGTGTSRHAFIGDSTTDYRSDINDPTVMWPLVYRNTLNALGFPTGGTGVVPTAHPGPLAIDSRWSSSGTVSSAGPYCTMTSAGATMTITTDKPGTIIDLVYYGTSAAFTFTIDGGSTITPARTGTLAPNHHNVTGLANMTHTIVITSSSSSAVYPMGLSCYSASGLVIDNIAAYGSAIYTNGSDQQWGNLTNPVGYYIGRTGLLPATPDVVYIALGINDNTGPSATVAAVKSQLSNIIGSFPNSDMILVAQHGALNTNATQSRQEQWTSGLYDLADSLDLPLFDNYTKSGGAWAVNFYTNVMMSDGVHLTRAGEQAWGRQVALLAAAA